MSMQLSIVVPVYNAEPYLEECLDSLTGQTLDDAVYEILLVDDKSTDNSLAVCNEYARRHGNIKVIALPENTPGGAGFPYNVGMRHAAGKYVGLVESDDYVSPEMFAELMAASEAANPAGTDITLCSFDMLYMNDGVTRQPYDIEYWRELFYPGFANLPETERKDKYLKISPVPWRKLYRREFLTANSVFFPVSDHPFEDTFFHWAAIIPARTITQIDKRLITYRAQRKGQSTGTEPARAALHIAEHLRGIQKMLHARKLQETYRNAFLHLAADTLNRVPETHPLYDQIKELFVAICAEA